MPKEIIHASTPTATTFNVAVGWANDRDVQVGITSTDGRSLLTILYGSDDQLLALGLAMRALVQHADATSASNSELGRSLLDQMEAEIGTGVGEEWVPFGAAYNSTWADLDRQQCNRLIRTLRKARDAAYGQDE